MGYTHYWRIKVGTKPVSKRCLKDIEKITSKYKELIQYEYDKSGFPIVTAKEIRFNGKGEEGHETFHILLPQEREKEFSEVNTKIYGNDEFVFNFCKTARKPYDLVVCEILLILKAELQDKMILESDGFSNSECSFDGCWNQAIEEVKRMGYKINCKVFSRDNGENPYFDCEILNVAKYKENAQ